jgi:hypothetical protein
MGILKEGQAAGHVLAKAPSKVKHLTKKKVAM